MVVADATGAATRLCPGNEAAAADLRAGADSGETADALDAMVAADATGAATVSVGLAARCSVRRESIDGAGAA
jgi:hypothetical protein